MGRAPARPQSIAAAILALTVACCGQPSAAQAPAGHAGHSSQPQQPSSFFDEFFKVYTPRRECMNLEAPVIWLHLVSDCLIGLAYYTIPVALVYFVRKRRDIVFDRVFWMFAAFILACGTTHFIGVWDLWQPMYKLDGVVKLATAAVSLFTAVMLWKLMPDALALPSPAQLELRVNERTLDLARANDLLRQEVEAREQAESERERLIESERKARTEAERANRIKDDFLATLSHELRSPLHAVLGWCELLKHADSPAKVTEGLAVITRNAHAQRKLIDDLLDVQRIVSGQLTLDLQSVDTCEVVQAAVESARPRAAAKGVTLDVALDEDAGRVSGDRDRLQQVMWNLLANAIKFTPAEGSIHVRLQRAGTRAEITVTDTGEGIEPEFLPHLFERFTQADASASRRHGGLGIGLAIVRHIVEMHGGSVRATSTGKGHGASFVVSLPRHIGGSRGVEESTAHAPAPKPPARALAGLRILTIDDDPDARRLIAETLQSAGAEVLAAGTGEEGVRLLAEERPDVLLCDIGLPGEDGLAVLRRVRALRAEEGGRTPAIAVTAFARPQDRANALFAGFQAHVAKPFDAGDLIAQIAGLAKRGADDRAVR